LIEVRNRSLLLFLINKNGSYPKKREYAHEIDGNVVIESALIRRFLEKLERVFQDERPYRLRLVSRELMELQCVRKLQSLKPMFRN